MLYALNCGRQQQPVPAKQLSKKCQRLKYKRRKRKLHERGNSALNKMSLEHKMPTIAELMESTLVRFITLAEMILDMRLQPRS